MRMIYAEGTPNQIGYRLGDQLKEEIRHNIASMKESSCYKAIDNKELTNYTNKHISFSSTSSLELMEGMSKGSGISFDSILRFNALQEILSPEGCTSFAAIGSATSNGNAFLLKNTDARGNQYFNNTRHYGNKEISVIQSIKINEENTIVGVTSVASVGIIMGLNKYGVAGAINFGQAAEISHLSSKELSEIGWSGRPQLLREGLEFPSARDAVNHILAKLTKSPMGTPGIFFFVDAGNIFVIEGTTLVTNQLAVQHIMNDGATARSNHFLLLKQLNDEKSISPICRKIRAQELLDQNFGKIDRNKLIEFSIDHKNGPEENSICRHSKNLESAVTVSAAIMEVDRENPIKSKISIALGSPCWAWSHHDGNITFQMDEDKKFIPQRFCDGTSFKKYFKAEPFQKE